MFLSFLELFAVVVVVVVVVLDKHVLEWHRQRNCHSTAVGAACVEYQ